MPSKYHLNAQRPKDKIKLVGFFSLTGQVIINLKGVPVATVHIPADCTLGYFAPHGKYAKSIRKVSDKRKQNSALTVQRKDTGELIQASWEENAHFSLFMQFGAAPEANCELQPDSTILSIKPIHGTKSNPATLICSWGQWCKLNIRNGTRSYPKRLMNIQWSSMTSFDPKEEWELQHEQKEQQVKERRASTNTFQKELNELEEGLLAADQLVNYFDAPMEEELSPMNWIIELGELEPFTADEDGEEEDFFLPDLPLQIGRETVEKT